MRITFVDAVMSAGLGQPSIMADRKLHRFKCARCAADGKRDNRHAWYVYHDDGIPAGAFGCWRCTEKQTWCGKSDTEMSPSDRAHLTELMRDAVRRRDEEQAREHNAAALLAARIYRASDRPATGHPYLLSKGVNEPPRVRSIMPADLRKVSAETSATLTGQGLTGRLLVVPMFDENGSQTSMQFIGENGKKSFLAGGRVRGCSFAIHGEDNSIVICEGLATAQTLHEATRATIIATFSAGNLEPVARSIFKKMPKAEILVAADNDLETEGNPGVTKGRAAASAINAWLAVPHFAEGATGSDFNDLAQAKGLDEVRRQVDAAEQAKDPTATEIPPIGDPIESTGAAESEIIVISSATNYEAESQPPVDPVLAAKGFGFDVAQEANPPAPDPLDDDAIGEDVGDTRTKVKKSQATTIVDLVLAENVSLWHDQSGEGWCTLPMTSHLEHWRLNRTQVRRWLEGRYYQRTGKAASAQGVPRSADKSPSCDFGCGRRPRRTARQEPRPPDRFIKHSLNPDGRAALLRRRADGASTRIRVS